MPAVPVNLTRIRVRGNITYELDPNDEIDNVALIAEPLIRYTFGLNHSLDQDLTEASVTANKASGRYNPSLGLRYDSNDIATFNASLAVGIGREPRSGEWYTDARTLASSGSVSAIAFLDGNQDGIFDAGNEPVADIGFRLNGGYSPVRSNDEGIGFLTGLPAHQPLNLSIAPETVSDPLWTVALDGVRVVPAPVTP